MAIRRSIEKSFFLSRTAVSLLPGTVTLGVALNIPFAPYNARFPSLASAQHYFQQALSSGPGPVITWMKVCENAESEHLAVHHLFSTHHKAGICVTFGL